jgi:AhpD family alkylhydroperoxidase
MTTDVRTRIFPLDPAAARGRERELLDAVQAQLGRIPNLYASMVRSPAALQGYLAFRAALQGGVLTPAMRERIALLTAQFNDCGYCVAAHCFRGAKAGLSEAELAATRRALSEDDKVAAALAFVAEMLERRGNVSDAVFNAVKAAGWTEEEVGEMTAHVALNVFSNYFNHAARPALDFPAPAAL